MSWRRKQAQRIKYELRMSRERVFQLVGVATAKLQEPKHVRTRGTQ